MHATTTTNARVVLVLVVVSIATSAQIGTVAFVPSQRQPLECVSKTSRIPSSRLIPWMAKNPWENILSNAKLSSKSEGGADANGGDKPENDQSIGTKTSSNKKTTPSTTLPFLDALGLIFSRDKEAPTPKVFSPTPPPPPALSSAIFEDQQVKRKTRSSSESSSKATTTRTKDSKFDFAQRIESIKAAVCGAASGSIGVAPVALLHHFFGMATTSSSSYSSFLSQWELTTDMAAVQGALFAIVYRYASRKGDDNPMLDQGVLGAFVLVRTLPSIQTTSECTAFPLHCGPPVGYFNWIMVNQGLIQGVESAALFGSVYLVLEYAFEKGWISKFD